MTGRAGRLHAWGWGQGSLDYLEEAPCIHPAGPAMPGPQHTGPWKQRIWSREQGWPPKSLQECKLPETTLCLVEPLSVAFFN